jgi:hypothetical protein
LAEVFISGASLVGDLCKTSIDADGRYRFSRAFGKEPDFGSLSIKFCGQDLIGDNYNNLGICFG